MAQEALPLPANVLHGERQILNFERIVTFIGRNGSGKSTVLKSIFDEKLKRTNYDDLKIVCFSSGQNESYSNDFSDYLSRERARRNALNLDCFYYDKSWSKLLIFLATSSKGNGLVRDFLVRDGYVIESDFDEDQSTKISFEVKVDRAYVNLVRQAIDDEEKGNQEVFTNKSYHRTLYNFINTIVEDGYNFETPLDTQTIFLDQDSLSKISFEFDEYAPFDSMVMFFTQASDNDYFIVKESFELRFSNRGKELRLEDLSDGEYQLLFIFALIDLFDSKNTLFLFDEADSHLHYKNIDKLWNVFERLAGRVITTSHLLDSISKSGMQRLRVVERGRVSSDIKLPYLASRLNDLSDINNAHLKALSLFKNIVFIDDENDWEIFKLLVFRKFSGDPEKVKLIENTLKDFIPIKQESGFEKTLQTFGGKKLGRLRAFSDYLEGHPHNTKHVFLICDRDELPLNDIGTDKSKLLVQGDSIKEHNEGGFKSHLLSWRRREIKHYLISPTALDDNLEVLNEKFDLGPQSQLITGSSGDLNAKGEYNEKVAMLPSNSVKEVVNPYINTEGSGFCIDKAREYVDKIPREEISEDIVEMYEYLGKCQ